MYYLACGEHPAWGYMDQPPLIAWIAWLLEHTIGVSLYALRLLPMLADVGTIVMTASVGAQAGRGPLGDVPGLAGSTWLRRSHLSLSHIFTMNAFDPVLWMLIAWLLVDLIQTGRETNWIWIGGLTGITLLNKYGVLFLVAGISCWRCVFASCGAVWQNFGSGQALAFATLIALPNFLWQLHRNFPFVQLVTSVRANGRDVMLPPLPYLGQQAVDDWVCFIANGDIGDLVPGFWLKEDVTEFLLWGFLSVLGCMLVLKGKFYYVAPVYPIIFAPGAVYFERLTERRRLKWTRPVYALMMIIGRCTHSSHRDSGPFYSERYVAYTKKLGIQQQKFENQPESKLPQLYADMVGWEERVKIVADLCELFAAGGEEKNGDRSLQLRRRGSG